MAIRRQRRITRLPQQEWRVGVHSVGQINLRRAPVLHGRKCVLLFRKKRSFVNIARERRERDFDRGVGTKFSAHHQLSSARVVAHESEALPIGREHRLTRVVYHRCAPAHAS